MSLATPQGLTPVQRQSVSDAVFEQLRAQIVGGSLTVGDPLPSERALCEALAVNRSSLREALRRLEQARLVSIRHGGTSRVLDYRDSAGLDLLNHLLVTADGQFDTRVVRSVMEMRSAIAPDAARLAAQRRSEPVVDALDRLVDSMTQRRGDLSQLQSLALEYWSSVIDAADNIAYRLAYNSLRETYARCQDLMTHVLAAELSAVELYADTARAIRRGNSKLAEQRARAIVALGERGVNDALALVEIKPGEDQR